MNDVFGNPISLNRYEMNETMRLLGNQYPIDVFWGNDEVRKGIEEIAEARPRSFDYDSAADIFMLGYIYGKRAERKRKKIKRII